MKEPLVTYIRIKELLHPYLIYSYGDMPVNLPETDELYDILQTGLVPNYSMKRLCYSTFSMAAFEKGVENRQVALFTDDPAKVFVPKPDDKSKLVPFVIPRTVIIGGRRRNTDKWFQLCNSSYNLFRTMIEKNFWNALDNFDKKVQLYCTRENLKYSIELSIEKFMIKVGMDMDDFDTLARNWREERARRNQQVTQFSHKEPTANLREQVDFDLITRKDNLESVYNR